MEWLDKIIEEQKEQNQILSSISNPITPAELQEIAENENWINEIETQINPS